MQIARSVVLLVSVLWGVHVLRMEGLRARYAAITAKTRSHPDLEHVPSESSSGSRVKSWLATVGAGHAVPFPRRRGVTGPQGSPGTHIAVGPEQNVDRRRALLRGAAVTLAFAAVTVLMTWPYARYLGSATVVGFDPFLQIWLSEWIQHALATDPLRLYQANIFYPFAQTLAYTDANVPGALLAAPLRFLTGDPLLTNSLLVLATFVVAATGVYALIVSICGNRGAAFIAGLAYAFLPYRMVHLWHLNWLEGALLPWVVLALLRLIDRPSIGRGFTLGLLAAMLVLTSFYFSIQVAMIGVVIAIAWSDCRQAPSNARVLPKRSGGRRGCSRDYRPALRALSASTGRAASGAFDRRRRAVQGAARVLPAACAVGRPEPGAAVTRRTRRRQRIADRGRAGAACRRPSTWRDRHRGRPLSRRRRHGVRGSRTPQLAPTALARDRPGGDRTDRPRPLAGTQFRSPARPGPAAAVWLALRSRPVLQSHARTGETRWAHKLDDRAPGRTGVGCQPGTACAPIRDSSSFRIARGPVQR